MDIAGNVHERDLARGANSIDINSILVYRTKGLKRARGLRTVSSLICSSRPNEHVVGGALLLLLLLHILGGMYRYGHNIRPPMKNEEGSVYNFMIAAFSKDVAHLCP